MNEESEFRVLSEVIYSILCGARARIAYALGIPYGSSFSTTGFEYLDAALNVRAEFLLLPRNSIFFVL